MQMRARKDGQTAERCSGWESRKLGEARSGVRPSVDGVLAAVPSLGLVMTTGAVGAAQRPGES